MTAHGAVGSRSRRVVEYVLRHHEAQCGARVGVGIEGLNALALGERQYYDGTYSDGGLRAIERSRTAAERALALDPELVTARRRLIILATEGGELEAAWDQASELLRRRPDAGESHFAAAYVLRYAGLLEEAARECQAAREIDPKNYQWRSCTIVFQQLRQYDRAKEYISLDGSTEWAAFQTMDTLLRDRKSTRLNSSHPSLSRMPSSA